MTADIKDLLEILARDARDPRCDIYAEAAREIGRLRELWAERPCCVPDDCTCVEWRGQRYRLPVTEITLRASRN